MGCCGRNWTTCPCCNSDQMILSNGRYECPTCDYVEQVEKVETSGVRDDKTKSS